MVFLKSETLKINALAIFCEQDLDFKNLDWIFIPTF